MVIGYYPRCLTNHDPSSCLEQGGGGGATGGGGRGFGEAWGKGGARGWDREIPGGGGGATGGGGRRLGEAWGKGGAKEWDREILGEEEGLGGTRCRKRRGCRRDGGVEQERDWKALKERGGGVAMDRGSNQRGGGGLR